MGAVLAGCGGMPKLVDESCDWCGSSPSYAYKVSNGVSYICEECRSTCYVCGEKATHHYENILGIMTFLCDEHYDERPQD